MVLVRMVLVRWWYKGLVLVRMVVNDSRENGTSENGTSENRY